MRDTESTDDLFEGALLPRLRGRRGWTWLAAREARVMARVAAFLAVAFIPLCLLTVMEGSHLTPGVPGSLFLDFGTLARYLAAGPLLIAGDGLCATVLAGIAARLGMLCVAADPASPAFAELIAGARRRQARRWPALMLACLAVAASVGITHGLPWHELPAWHRSGSGHSLAGWWNATVSLPLLLVLLLGWLWRLVHWSWFLWRVSRLPMRLVAVHPDQSGGIGFVGYSLRGFSPFGAAFGSMVAGTVAERVVHAGATLMDHRMVVLGAVAGVVTLFGAPLLLFSRKLVRVWWEGVRDYGALASAFGRQFEDKWFVGGAPAQRDMLERGDFSAATDLYQVVDRVHSLRVLPVDIMSAAALAGATLLPMLPVVVMVLPLDVLWHAFASLLR